MIKAWLRREQAMLTACASGVLLALAFPRPSFAFLAWLALVPMLISSRQHPFRSGFVTGLVFYGFLLYWLNIVMTTYGRLHPVLSGVAWLLLAGYLALYFGATTWLAWRLRERFSLPVWITFPVVWIGLDYLREFFLTGFPWGALGYSQLTYLPLVQSADLFGVYGLTGLIVFSNGVIAHALSTWSTLRKVPVVAVVCLCLLFTANLGYGIFKLNQPLDQREETLKISLVQGNIDQSVKWNPEWQQKTIDRYLELSGQGVETGADLLIWPESATPFYFQDGRENSTKIRNFSRDHRVGLLFGSPAYRTEGSGFSLLNSAFVLSREGDVLGRSDKVHLVPFGEYVPLKTFFPFIDKLVVGVGDFSPGTLTPLDYAGHQLGVLVCYEGIFPELSRSLVDRGADLLVNITNDAWYGRSSAPYQHLSMVRMRAIENRVWLARAANTGVSALFAPSGRTVAATTIFEALQVTETAGLGAGESIYRRTGDTLPALCLGASLFAVLGLLKKRRQPDTLSHERVPEE